VNESLVAFPDEKVMIFCSWGTQWDDPESTEEEEEEEDETEAWPEEEDELSNVTAAWTADEWPEDDEEPEEALAHPSAARLWEVQALGNAKGWKLTPLWLSEEKTPGVTSLGLALMRSSSACFSKQCLLFL
jgi:hypothetical protein